MKSYMDWLAEGVENLHNNSHDAHELTLRTGDGEASRYSHDAFNYSRDDNNGMAALMHKRASDVLRRKGYRDAAAAHDLAFRGHSARGLERAQGRI